MIDCNHDLERLEEDLQSDASRIFLDDAESYIQVIASDGAVLCLEGTNALVDYLETSKEYRGTRIISIPQLGSVGQLGISHTGFKALLATMGNFPPVLEMVRAFGTKVNHDANPIPPHQSYFDQSRSTYYCSFVTKYAEEHGRPNTTTPWTVRQMGIFLTSDEQRHQHTVVMINPMKRVVKRIKKGSIETSLKTADVLSLALSTALHRWPAYLDYLESSCNQLVSRSRRGVRAKANDSKQTKASVESVIMNSNNHPGLQLGISVADLETLQRIRSTLQEAVRALHVDLGILKSLQAMIRLSTTQSLPDVMVTRLSNELDRCQVLLLSLNDTVEMVRTVLERQQSYKASEMAQLAAVDTSVMLELSKKAQKDSRTLRVITILTLLYLPATFVSTLLSMGYIHITSSKPHHLYFDPEFLIFVTLTVCFLCITVGVWLWFEPREKHRRRDQNKRGTEPDEKAIMTV